MFTTKEILKLLSTNIPFIKFLMSLNITLGTGYNSWKFQYATAVYTLIESGITNQQYLDIGCEISFYDIDIMS